jgi:hypothetical protein
VSAAHLEVLPGFTRADLQWQAECLEGRHGEARVAEAAPLAAKFIRAALAQHMRIPRLLRELQTEGERMAAAAATPGDGGVILPAVPIAVGGAGPDDKAFVLSPDEQRLVLKQRAHAERNRGDEDEVPA